MGKRSKSKEILAGTENKEGQGAILLLCFFSKVSRDTSEEMPWHALVPSFGEVWQISFLLDGLVQQCWYRSYRLTYPCGMGASTMGNNWGESKGCLNSTEIPKVGIPKLGIPKTGIPKTGIPKVGKTTLGLSPRQRFPKPGIPKTGIPKAGIPKTGIPKAGIPKLGMPKMGRFRAPLIQTPLRLPLKQDCFQILSNRAQFCNCDDLRRAKSPIANR